ncbi:MAG: GatB/YqeY domain-containing protein [Betaproteobacteria bacterium]|nr:MAG: GatB/YqeY domain-containing protein [Betaproteobacteria bacterium]
MGLKERIQEDMKAAMRARESVRLSAIRLLLAALKQKEVDERVVLDESAILGVIEKMIKQRRESIVQYEKAARNDLADVEKFEIGVLATYLPQQMAEDEIAAAVAAAVTESGAVGVKDMGKVMALLKSRLAGRADMGQVSARVKARLGA